MNGNKSDDMEMGAGTLQGGVLSARIFNFYIADIPELHNVQRFNFADDTNLLMKIINPVADIIHLQNAIDKLTEYFT